VEQILGGDGQPPPERGQAGEVKSDRGEEHRGDTLCETSLRSPVEEEHGEASPLPSPSPSREARRERLGISFPTSRVADRSPRERRGRARVHPHRGQPNGAMGCPGVIRPVDCTPREN
jgi:hypothetical protein